MSNYFIFFLQGFVAPGVVGGFVFFHPILSGKSVNEAKKIFASNYWDILKRAYMVIGYYHMFSLTLLFCK